MALADYRLCDVCQDKAFYDSELSYDFKEYPDTGLYNVGAWGVLCRDCIKTHRVVILPVDPAGVKEPLLPCGLCGTKPGPDDLVFCPNEKCGAVLVTQSEADEHARGVAIPAGYRLLANGEMIERGDELLDDDTVTWHPVDAWAIGTAWDGTAYVPVRRRTSGVKTPLEPSEAQAHITALLVAHRDMIDAQAKADKAVEVEAAGRMQQHREALAAGVVVGCYQTVCKDADGTRRVKDE